MKVTAQLDPLCINTLRFLLYLRMALYGRITQLSIESDPEVPSIKRIILIFVTGAAGQLGFLVIAVINGLPWRTKIGTLLT
jgi:hypothetical protein